jgi:CO dehydrogenase nickel-insertion accessory protein CooC1
LLIDSPAGIDHDDLRELTRDATSILIPVLPSSMNIHAAARCVADLLLVAKVDRRDRKLTVVANRTRKKTRSFAALMRFLDSLGIPIIAVLRDTQNFVRSAVDVAQIEKILSWLDDRPKRRRESSLITSINKPPSAARSLLRRVQFGSA